jgi:ABC-type arginine transport system ATPase subunit
MITDKTGDVSDRNNKPNNMSTSSADSQDEKKVKDLNREIMMVFQMYKASFGHTSAALLSVLSYLSENYIRQHPESKQTLIEYLEKEFDKFLNMINKRNQP